MIPDLFKAIDEKNSAKFASFLAPDCLFRFGNGPVVKNKSEIEQFVSGFFDSIEALSHEIIDSWEVSNGAVCHGRVTYTRKNGSSLTIPFSNIFKIAPSGIAEYLIFADTSELYS